MNKHVDPLAHEGAFKRSRLIPAKLRDELCKAIDFDLLCLKQCKDSKARWNSLAFAMNMAALLAIMGICSDEESKRIIREGHEAMGSIRGRVVAGHGWTLRAEEIAALDLAAERAKIQLRYASAGEWDRARSAVLHTNAQAEARGVPPGKRFNIRRA